MVTLLHECVEKEQNSCPEQLKLEAYISPNFMGFFLNEDCETIFKSFAVQFVKGLQDMSEFIFRNLSFCLIYYGFYVNRYYGGSS
jgi:hypothetical protein